MSKSDFKTNIIKCLSIIIAILLAALLTVGVCLHSFCLPLRDKDKHNQVINCFTYLIEILGRGAQVEMKQSSYKGFGVYAEKYCLSKAELTNLEISGNDVNAVADCKNPTAVTEFIELKYFTDKISIKQKSSITEKQGKLTLKFKQTGVKGLSATNKLFLNDTPTVNILNSSTNCLDVDEFDNGSVLFSCKQELSLEEAVEYMKTWNDEEFVPVLLTDSLAVKAGDGENSPVLFLKTATQYSQPIGDSAKGYSSYLTGILQYLVEHYEITQKILNTGIFGDTAIDIKEVQEYIAVNGVNVIGYNAVDTKLCSNSIYDSVILREQDCISKLVQVNNGKQVFKN